MTMTPQEFIEKLKNSKNPMLKQLAADVEKKFDISKLAKTKEE